eukprot:scaffold65413_cov54-Phaeocystis_antarctica.AAC.1
MLPKITSGRRPDTHLDSAGCRVPGEAPGRHTQPAEGKAARGTLQGRHEDEVRIDGLHRRSNSAIWHAKKPGVSTSTVALAAPAAPSAVYPSAMVAPAAYSQQAALQLPGVSPAPAIAYGVPTSAPAITYYPCV